MDDAQQLSRQVADRLKIETVDVADRVEVVGGYAEESYGAVTEAVLEAISLYGRLEGLILDPEYTGREAAGLIGLIRRGGFSPDEMVVLVHTGGWPVLLAYRTEVAGLS